MKLTNNILNLNFSEKKIFIYNNSINILLMIKVVILLFPACLSLNCKSKLIKLLNNSKITITIKGNGTQKILGINTGCSGYNGELPDYVYVNGINKYNKVYEVSNLISIENKITLEWNSSLTSCYCMFCRLYNITKVDVSKFDTSQVKNMAAMFSYNILLVSLNLNSFNTSSVTDMHEMFYHCYSLKILDLSNFQTNSYISKTNMFSNCSSSLIVCLDTIKANSILSELPSDYQNNCEEVHLRLNRKKIFEKDYYLYNCEDDLEYKYEYNNTCYKSCPENTYYNQTLCIDIPNGYYLNDTNLMTINKCNEKCKTCSKESAYLNLCKTCNNDSNYFPILNYNNSINESFFDCGKNIQEEFYLDLEDNVYKPCFSSCKKCYKHGNEFQHNCDECKNNYIALNDTDNNNNNCYEKCNFFYYFDSNKKYQCTTYKKCPDNFNKLIPEKNKCISNCSEDNHYQYEFNNICYKSCPNGTINNNNLCEAKLKNDFIERKEFIISAFFDDKSNI